MKQILQNLGSGETLLVEVPVPTVSRGGMLIRSGSSLVSLGTERMLLEFGKASLLGKVRKQPDKVKQVLQKVKTDGFSATLNAVRAKLDQPLALGYCNAGTVIEVGSAAAEAGFAVGDRVVSNGGHAEVVKVAKNLCAKIPDGVPDEHAAFTVLASIGLQGVRLLEPTLGERVVVVGLGLIGLLTVQLLRANGCEVLGLDFVEEKCELARQFGAEAFNLSSGGDPVRIAEAFSGGRGVDGVLITASTNSNEPLSQAAQMCRKRGRVVLVGVVGNEWNRADFYEKEVSFQVSCSYGPGRYDEAYESQGQDYPIGFVRWTEQRNFEAILQLMASGKLDPSPLISHRADFSDALSAYEKVSVPGTMGIVLNYPASSPADADSPADSPALTRTVRLSAPTRNTTPGAPVVGVIGAGNFTGQVLLPAIAATGARLHTIASGSGVTGTHHGEKQGFEFSTTDTEGLLANPEINTVFITTRHGSHADLVVKALGHGKHVFVEKPLAVTDEQLQAVEAALESATGSLMIGFNRRFAPLAVAAKTARESLSGPVAMTMLVNAGELPGDHWTQQPQHGGRIIGEGCHFIDFLRFMAGAPVESAKTDFMQAAQNDTAVLTLRFTDGSVGTVQYFSNGTKAFPKERFECFGDGKVLQIDNFRRLNAFGFTNLKNQKLRKLDKGHAAEVAAFMDSIRAGGPPPIPADELLEVSRLSIQLSTPS